MRWYKLLFKELPLRTQFGAFLAVWLSWLAALGWVVLHAWANVQAEKHFAYPFRVYGPVLFWLPVVLTCSGLLFIARQGPIYNRARGVHWWVITWLTVISGGIALLGTV